MIETCIFFFPFVWCVTQLSHSDYASLFSEVKLVILIFNKVFFNEINQKLKSCEKFSTAGVRDIGTAGGLVLYPFHQIYLF